MLDDGLDLDEVVHQRSRLGIMALLSEARTADFAHLERTLNLTDGNLGRHLEVLAAAGLVTVEKTTTARGTRTYATITAEGLRALRREKDALRRILSLEVGPSLCSLR